MDQHYSAFISYRHAPADIAVASEIQKRLERYVVPKAIREKTGKKSIGRIFRDKEELPITSDLNDDISAALSDADFLIVICSTATKGSMWVPREIDCFLQNHSKRQILTVLVDGEPFDVIPEQLLGDTVTRTAPDGTTYEEHVSYEPLSCDFRPGIRTAARTEIPRLAAALLGCSYDELVMRERQYKRRRLTAALSVTGVLMTVAIAYLLWSRSEIQKNYELAQYNYELSEQNYALAQENYRKAEDNYQEAQENLRQAMINQSVFLSETADRVLDEGDRILAMQLIREALPSPQNERPLTARAQEAAVQALNAYSPPETEDYRNGMMTLAEFETDGTIEDYFVDPDIQYVFVRDSYGTVSVWDLATYERVFFIKSGSSEAENEDTAQGEIQDAKCLSDGMLAVLTDRGVEGWSYTEGTRIWRYAGDSGKWYSAGIGVSRELNEVAVIIPEEEYKDGAYQYSMRAVLLDSRDGSVKQEVKSETDFTDSHYTGVVRISPEGKWAAFVMRKIGISEYSSRVFLWNLESGEIRESTAPGELQSVQALYFRNEEALYVCGYPSYSLEHSGGSVSMFGIMTTAEDLDIVVTALRPETDEMLFRQTFTSPQIHKLSNGKGLTVFDSKDAEGRDRFFAAAVYANKVLIMDADTGEVYDEVECTGSVVNVQINTNGSMILPLDKGVLGVYNPTRPGSISEMGYFDYETMSLMRIDTETSRIGFLVMPDTHRLWLSDVVYDEAFTRYKQAPLPGDVTIQDEDIAADTLMVCSFDDDVFLYDLSDQRERIQVAFEVPVRQLDYLGKSKDAGIFWFFDYQGGHDSALLAVSAGDGGVERYEGLSGFDDYYTVAENGNICYLADDRFIVASPEDGKLKELFSCENENSRSSFFINKDAARAAVRVDDGKEASGYGVVMYNLESGESFRLDTHFQETMKAAFWNDDKSRVLVTDGYTAAMFDGMGKHLADFAETGKKVVTGTFYKDMLFVLFSDGLLTRYDASDGRSLGRTSLSHYKSESFMEDTDWDFEGDRLYLHRSSITMNVLHCIAADTWEEELATAYGEGYDKARDRIISYGLDRNTKEKYFGYFEHYSADELRDKLTEALHGNELSPEQRALYGLD